MTESTDTSARSADALIDLAKNALKALEPFADTVFNDNGDMTVTESRLCDADFRSAYLARNVLANWLILETNTPRNDTDRQSDPTAGSSSYDLILRASRRAERVLAPFANQVSEQKGLLTVTKIFLNDYPDFCNAYIVHKELKHALEKACIPESKTDRSTDTDAAELPRTKPDIPPEQPTETGFQLQITETLSSALRGLIVVTETVSSTYRGERGLRTIIPKGTFFGSTQWHPEPQYFLIAHDVEKNAERQFALLDIHSFSPVRTPLK